MGKKIDPRNFLLNTDYEMDKIIYYNKLELTVSSETSHEIQHDLPTAPLIFGVYSENEDLSEARELYYTSENNGESYCSATSTNSKISLSIRPRKSGGSYVKTKFYICLFGFEPSSDYHIVPDQATAPTLIEKKLAPTYKFAKNFVINTDYNYLKLLTNSPKFNYDNDAGCYVYNHNLGYLPKVMAWNTFGWDDSLGDWEIEFWGNGQSYFAYDDTNYSINYKTGVFVTDDKVKFFGTGVIPAYIESRVYADEA